MHFGPLDPTTVKNYNKFDPKNHEKSNYRWEQGHHEAFCEFQIFSKTAFFSTEVHNIITPSLLRVTTGQRQLGNPQIEQFKSKNMGFMAKITKLTISQLEPAFKGLYAKNDDIFTNINARTKLYISK